MDVKNILYLVGGTIFFVFLLSLLNSFVGGSDLISAVGAIGFSASIGFLVLIGGIFVFIFIWGEVDRDNKSPPLLRH